MSSPHDPPQPDSPDPSGGALPNSLPRPAGEREALERAWRPPTGWRRLTAVNNNIIGPY